MRTGLTHPDPPRLEGTVRVGPRRRLGYAVFGPAEGRTVLWFHGTPGGRRQVPPGARRFADTHGVRVVGVERPGIGTSTPHLYDQVGDFAEDIARVLDAVHADEARVVGLSGGGPYALACAARLPERVPAVAILGGVAPLVGPDAVRGGLLRWLRRSSPALVALRDPLGAIVSRLVRAAHPVAHQAYALYAALSPPGDRAVFAAPGVEAMFLDDMLDATRTSMRSVIDDAILFSRPWGFGLEEVRRPALFWHGDADPLIPFPHAEHVVERVPGATLRRQPGLSHLAGLACAEEVLEALLAA